MVTGPTLTKTWLYPKQQGHSGLKTVVGLYRTCEAWMKAWKVTQVNGGYAVLKIVPSSSNTGGIQLRVTVWAAVKVEFLLKSANIREGGGFWHSLVLPRAKPTQASALTHHFKLHKKSLAFGRHTWWRSLSACWPTKQLVVDFVLRREIPPVLLVLVPVGFFGVSHAKLSFAMLWILK